jgi:Na+/H+ antiporter NhaD/arsenite permease-like protein
VALLGAGVLVASGVLGIEEAAAYINWETLGLLAGMFVLVAVLNEAGFFSWLSMTALRRVGFHPSYLFIILFVLAGFLAMWMDSITVMLFLASLTIQLCRLLKLDPLPLVIAEVCAANTGGAATLVGDPPNVILGTTLGFSFADFLTHTGPISAAAALLLLAVFYAINRARLREARAALTPAVIASIEAEHNEPLHAHLTRVGLAFFGLAVLLLVTHHPLSHATGLPVTSAAAALIPAAGALIFMRSDQARRVALRFDGESILFFAGLFVIIGGLEKVHLFEALARGLAQIGDAGHGGLVMALHWGPGLMSGVVDNVPLALAMSYVLENLAQQPGMPALGMMVWALALGVDMGGNLTPIGASANVVAYSVVERHHGKIGWGRWVALAAPPTILAMILASGLLMMKSNIGWY